jgi:hypothetical protein
MHSDETSSSQAARRRLLEDIADYYRETVVGVRSRFMAGMAQPPLAFVNRELERRGEGWRV